jgi:hypothetical protein
MFRLCSFLLAVLSLFTPALAGDDEWLSPVYKHFYQFPLPLPGDKAPKYVWTNKTTGRIIKYYEVVISPLTQQSKLTFRLQRIPDADEVQYTRT